MLGPPKGVGVGGGPCVLLFEKALIFGDSLDWWSIVLAVRQLLARVPLTGAA